MTKQCSEVFTDGEETQEQNKFHRLIHSILALRCHPIKGKSKSEILMAREGPRAQKSKNRVHPSSVGFVVLEWFSDLGR